MPKEIGSLRRVCWGTFGLGYLLLAATFLSQLARTPLWVTWLAVLTAAALLTTLLLIWLTRLAFSQGVRRNQFSLAAMLVAITLLAVFLAAVRWLVARSPELPPGDLLFFSIFAVLCLAILVSALPGALFVADAVLWLAVWILRHLRARRRAGNPPAESLAEGLPTRRRM